MRKTLAFLLACLLLAGCSAPAQEPVTEPTATEPEPTVEEPTEVTEEEVEEAPLSLGTFSAETLDGETITEAIFADADLTVINVWATYCGPCKEEMPVLGMLDQELETVQMLGIVTDVIDQTGAPDPAQIELALELADAAGCGYPNLVLNQSLAYLGFASLSAVPATLFVDNQGNLVGQGFYGALDEATWRQVIQERLEMAQQ